MAIPGLSSFHPAAFPSASVFHANPTNMGVGFEKVGQSQPQQPTGPRSMPQFGGCGMCGTKFSALA